jgi:GNAT superfamily N-acetyltransferase
MSPLPDGYSDLATGKVANVQTSLEMFGRPLLRAEMFDSPLVLVRAKPVDLGWYRALFRRIGEPYLWFSRLVMLDDELARIVGDERVEVYSVRSDGEDIGLVELDFRQPYECELSFFGTTEKAIGTGTGRWMMNRAIERAWSMPIRRFWVHTCTLDHTAALSFYIRSGFVPFKRQIEVFDDPRLTGVLSSSAGPDVPIIGVQGASSNTAAPSLQRSVTP